MCERSLNDRILDLMQERDEAKKRVAELEELLRSACAIAERRGEGTHWGRFIASVNKLGLNGVTARTYRVLESDTEEAEKAKTE